MATYTEAEGSDGPMAVVGDLLDEVCWETLQQGASEDSVADFLEEYAEDVRDGRLSDDETSEQETWVEGGPASGHGQA